MMHWEKLNRKVVVSREIANMETWPDKSRKITSVGLPINRGTSGYKALCWQASALLKCPWARHRYHKCPECTALALDDFAGEFVWILRQNLRNDSVKNEDRALVGPVWPRLTAVYCGASRSEVERAVEINLYAILRDYFLGFKKSNSCRMWHDSWKKNVSLRCNSGHCCFGM